VQDRNDSRQHLTDIRVSVEQSFIDQWCRRLHACIRVTWNVHFLVNLELSSCSWCTHAIYFLFCTCWFFCMIVISSISFILCSVTICVIIGLSSFPVYTSQLSLIFHTYLCLYCWSLLCWCEQLHVILCIVSKFWSLIEQ